MSLRTPTTRLTSALRQQTSSLHTTSICSAFRVPPSSSSSTSRSSTSNLLNLDNDSRTPPKTQSSHDALASMLRSSDSSSSPRLARRARTTPSGSGSATDGISARTRDELQSREVSDRFARMMPRYWREGDVYSPQDLGAYEARKFRGQRGQATKKGDVMDLLGVNPKDLYRNFSVVGDFMTPFGRIKHSSETGLRLVNQRRMAKTIRRAIGLGIHPSVYRHPMILLKDSLTKKGL